MPRKQYFLPESLKSALGHESAQGLKSVESTIEVDGFKVPGVLLSGSARALKAFIAKATVPDSGNMLLSIRRLPKEFGGSEKGDLQEIGTGSIGREIYPILGTDPFVAVAMEHMAKLLFIEKLMEDFRKTLERFSSYTGLGVYFHLNNLLSVRSYKKHGNCIDIVIGAAPPGDATEVEHTHLCDIELHDEEHPVKHPGPAKGYGVVVKDEKGAAIAQIVDATIYLLLPMAPSLWRTLTVKNGGGLFKKALQAAWNVYIENPSPPADVTIEDASSYCRFLQHWFEEWPKGNREIVAELDAALKKAESHYRSLLTQKRMALNQLHQLETLAKTTDHETWAQDWARLQQLPGVSRVSTIDGGVHVQTKPLVIEHNAKRYRIGSLLIRIGNLGSVSILPHEPAHFDGKPHPHVGAGGNPCFGNVSTAITKAASEMRVADAVELTLRWLVEGYDPTLTESSIDEWPLAEEVAQ